MLWDAAKRSLPMLRPSINFGASIVMLNILGMARRADGSSCCYVIIPAHRMFSLGKTAGKHPMSSLTVPREDVDVVG